MHGTRAQEEDDDWAPLPPERMVLRPGEVDDVVVPVDTRVAAAEPTPRSAREPAAVDPRAEEMLRELQDRIAAAGPSTSLVSSCHRRAAREQRAQRRGDELRQAFAVGSEPCDPPALVYDDGPDGRDEREESDWFRGLPEQEQQRLHAAWAHRRGLVTCNQEAQRRNGNRRMVAAWVTFVATVLLGSGMLWLATLGGGVLCGLWWRRSAPDRFVDPLRALGCLFAAQALAMIVHDAANPALFMDAVFVIALSALVGFDGEIRRTGGFDVPHRGMHG